MWAMPFSSSSVACSLERISPVSLGSKSFKRIFLPSSTRYGLASLPAQLTKSPFCLKSGPKSSKIPDKSHSGICARSAFDGFPQRFSLRDGGHRHHGYAAVVYTSFPTRLRASSFAGRYLCCECLETGELFCSQCCSPF